MPSGADASERLLRRARLHVDLIEPEGVLEALVETHPTWASIWREGSRLDGFVSFTHASGRLDTYAIAIAYDDGALRVFEREPRRMDTQCPGRHFYADGSFCLGFRLPGALPSKDWARAWWTRLGGYIELQVEAELLGDWPDRYSWPHTTIGAQTQAALEAILQTLDSKIRSWLAANVTSPRECPCESGRLFESCHGPAVAAVRALEAMRRSQDEEFWARLRRERVCCGVLKDCPLRRPVDLFET